MQSAVPVVDHIKRAAIGEIKAKSPFNVFNIVALIAILVIGYFLYKKFTEKFQKGAISIPQVSAPIKKESVSIVAQAAEVPSPEDDEVVPA
jgi:NhaP-type Na+/H+ and K+/H+ antiporter